LTTPAIDLPARLFAVPAYLAYVQPRLTPAAVARAEARLGVRLPAAYLAALGVQNGGPLRTTKHPKGNGSVKHLAGIGRRFPTILAHGWKEEKRYMAEEGLTKPARLDDLISFSGDGHYHYCLDYRASGRQGEPRVSFIDLESYDEDRVVAPDFLTFLRALRVEETTEALGLVTPLGLKSLAAKLSAATRLAFKDDGSETYGYRVFYAALPRNRSARLEANRAPRGFARKGEADHGKVRARMAEEVDRYPEHADCACFLFADFDTPAGRKLLGALEKLSIPSRRVRLDG
jgi:hypothetical protein